MKPRVILLSAYDAASHRHWRKILQDCLGDFEWTVLTLPARHFNWRIRGNSLSWSQEKSAVLNQPFDLCVATSMVDLATLRGLVPALAQIPTLLYFHENQFAYPLGKEAKRLEPMMVQLYSALAADKLCFNTEYNRNTFLEGLGNLLKQFPDHVPLDIIQQLTEKSSVIPVPITANIEDRENYDKNNASVVWNHRWEYDKGPDRLLALLRALPVTLQLTVHVLGQSFRRVPNEFDEIKQLLQIRGWLGHWGFVEDELAYHNILASSEFVLSTAEHDFQGLSVLEATAQGCIPVLPDRLAYRELFSESYLYSSHNCIDREAESAAAHMARALAGQRSPSMTPKHFTADALIPRYRRLFSGLLSTPAAKSL